MFFNNGRAARALCFLICFSRMLGALWAWVLRADGFEGGFVSERVDCRFSSAARAGLSIILLGSMRGI